MRHDLQNSKILQTRNSFAVSLVSSLTHSAISTAAQPSALPLSATGGGRCSVPHELALRPRNPNNMIQLNFVHITRNPSGECPRDFFGCGDGI